MEPLDNPGQPPAAVIEMLSRRVRTLTILVAVLILAQFLLTAAVLGELLNWFGLQVSLYALYTGVCFGAAITGFIIGWIARRGSRR